MLDHTHEASARSWLESANGAACDFPIQNLPFAVFRKKGSNQPWRGGVGIGDQILDLRALADSDQLLPSLRTIIRVAGQDSLNDLMAMGEHTWRLLRHGLFHLLRAGSDASHWLANHMVPMQDAEFTIPARIGDYTDFYTSIHHARTISKLLNMGGDVSKNFQWIPTAYHGRVSSIGVAGQEFRRPNGQRIEVGQSEPAYGPCRRLDYELELGIYIGPGNAQGEPIDIEAAEAQIFGLCLLNDWSARDIQAWEMSPLGPFHSKNFATTISPWIVTMAALAPFRQPWTRPETDPQPLSYLEGRANRAAGAIDISLEVRIQTEEMRDVRTEPEILSQTSFVHHYWSIAQMVTHHAAGGCNLRPGDLLGSGTISGPVIEQAGAMMELALAGAKPVQLTSGESRSFLEDGDEISFRGWCEKEGYARIGFGLNTGRVLPAQKLATKAA